ncbi:uncharacterized protein LOC117579299 [Drosophila guanche]|uniref:Uncharacterized protein n=1 Tax=Drosophila guanche TaxID=7266 RepID=A0A3B0J9A0_DROGU|nr:uncharacterized protein LOC117579299 [Drosophila guanche]SPP76502.1 Hypothetical predicted protein [Drosophila guanche]
MLFAKHSVVVALILVQLVGLIQSGSYNNEDTWVYIYPAMDFPNKAVVGGLDSDGYYNYVGRSVYSSSILPARVVPELKKATYNSDTVSYQTTSLEVLVSNYTVSYHWQRSFDGFLEKNAVSVGTNSNNDNVYICRFRADQGLLMGTLYLANRTCIVKYGEMPLRKQEKYEILVRERKAADFMPF